MNRHYRMIALVAAVITFIHGPFFISETHAQKRVEGHVKADLVSHYWWRGMDLGGVSIQPAASIGWQGFKLGVDGSTGIESTDRREIHLSLGYNFSGVNIGVIDHWNNSVDPDHRYFYYNEKKSGHLYEANLGYTCKYFSLQGYTIFWGNDYKISGDQAYSTYIELDIPFMLGGVYWDIKAGISPFERAGYQTETETEAGLDYTYKTYHQYYYYGGGFSCVMASLRATKNLDLGFTEIPVFAEFHTNPYMRKADLLLGITINPF